jgi:hypothetical protein
LKGLERKKVGILYAHLEYISAIWYILWQCGNLVEIWYIFPCFGTLKKTNLSTLVHTYIFHEKFFFVWKKIFLKLSLEELSLNLKKFPVFKTQKYSTDDNNNGDTAFGNFLN